MAPRLPRGLAGVRPGVPQGVPRLRRARPALGGLDAQARRRPGGQGRRGTGARGARQRRRPAPGGLLRRPHDVLRLLHLAPGPARRLAHLRHHPVLRPVAGHPARLDPRRLRRARRADRAGVPDARPGRADLVDGADEPAAPARRLPGPDVGLGAAPLRPGRPRAAHPLRPDAGRPRRGVRAGRLVAGPLRAALRPRRPRRPLRPARHRLPRARPEPRGQRLPQGRRPPRRPGRRDGRPLPRRLRRRRALRFPDVDLAAVWPSARHLR